MRKLISVLTIAVLVLALAVPTFAAPNSPTLPSGGVTEVTPTVGDAVDPVTGEKVDVVVSEPKLEAGETLQSVAEDALKAAKEAGAPVENARSPSSVRRIPVKSRRSCIRLRMVLGTKLSSRRMLTAPLLSPLSISARSCF